MAEISKHLMTFARKPRRETRPVVLAEVLDDTLDFLRPRLERAGATVSVDQPDRSLTVRAGNVRLQHVILNLVSNALDATKKQLGQAQAAPRLAFAVRGAKGRVILSLPDPGPGFSPDAPDRLFDPFFSPTGFGDGPGPAPSLPYTLRH